MKTVNFKSNLVKLMFIVFGFTLFLLFIRRKKGGITSLTIPVPEEIIGKEWREGLIFIHLERHGTLLGVKPDGGEIQLNPKTHCFSEGDTLLVMETIAT